MKNSIIIIVLFFVSIAFSCGSKKSTSKDKSEYIAEQLTNLKGCSSAKDVFPFTNWDYLFCMDHYTDPERLVFLSESDREILQNTGIKSMDDRCVLVFIGNDSIVSYSVIKDGENQIVIIGDYWPVLIQKSDSINKSSILNEFNVYEICFKSSEIPSL